MAFFKEKMLLNQCFVGESSWWRTPVLLIHAEIRLNHEVLQIETWLHRDVSKSCRSTTWRDPYDRIPNYTTGEFPLWMLVQETRSCLSKLIIITEKSVSGSSKHIHSCIKIVFYCSYYWSVSSHETFNLHHLFIPQRYIFNHIPWTVI